ncbi:MAG TPA: relaxase/mobilization nuclease domain-containing protein [Candidatus Faecousia faecavium]|nr:relaxase/mobilization nuclease domain-containing protein [Candidatus Faecousia faecavium]
MAVMKINNDKDYITGKSKYKDPNALKNVYQYMIDQKNTGKSKKVQNHYIGGSHVDLSDPAGSMEEVAKKYHKDRGVRLKHIIVSFAEQDNVTAHMIASAAEEMSQRIGQLYQNFYVVHEDRRSPHIHMMMNTVSHVNGYKYHPQTDKSWLSEIGADCMDELGVYSFRVYGR